MNNGGYYMLDLKGIPDIQTLAGSPSLESDTIPGLTACIDECVKLGKPLMLCNMRYSTLTMPPVCGTVILPAGISANSYLIHIPGYRLNIDRADTVSVVAVRYN